MKVGDKVKHVNTGEKIHTIIALHGHIATCLKDNTLWRRLNGNSINSPIIREMVCNIKNLEVWEEISNEGDS